MASITKRGPKSFHARVRRTGYPTLSRTFDTLAEARKWARDREREMDRGTLPDTLEAQRRTLSEAYEDYRTHVTPRHRGADSEDLRLRAMNRHSMASLPLAKLDAFVIEEYIADRLESVCGSTVNRELSILTQVLKRARKRKWMAHNPMEEVDRPPESPNRNRRLSKAEHARFQESLKTTRNRLFKAFLTVSLETGMRRGEQLSIDWPQTDLEERMIRLRADQTKNGMPRDVPLSKLATETLRSLLKKTGRKRFVFDGLTADAVKKCWQRVCNRAGIEDFRFHDLRHERVSSLIDEGWSVLQAMAVSGHQDMRAFRRYAHPNVETIVAKLDELKQR